MVWGGGGEGGEVERSREGEGRERGWLPCPWGCFVCLAQPTKQDASLVTLDPLSLPDSGDSIDPKKPQDPTDKQEMP